MRRILGILLSFFMTVTVQAQVTLSQAQLDSLPEAARLAIQASVAKEEAKQKVEAVSEYVGLGREIGEAVNGALGAVEDHVLSIASSDLGQTAIFIVSWKLLYKDIVGIMIGLILLTIMCIWLWHSFRYMKTEEFEKWHSDSQCGYMIICAAGWAVLFVVSMLCIF